MNEVPWNHRGGWPNLGLESESGIAPVIIQAGSFWAGRELQEGPSRKGSSMSKSMTAHGMLKEWQYTQVNPTPHANQHSAMFVTHSTRYQGYKGKKCLLSRTSCLPPRQHTGEIQLNTVCCRGLNWFLWEWTKAFLTVNLGKDCSHCSTAFSGLLIPHSESEEEFPSEIELSLVGGHLWGAEQKYRSSIIIFSRPCVLEGFLGGLLLFFLFCLTSEHLGLIICASLTLQNHRKEFWLLDFISYMGSQ